MTPKQRNHEITLMLKNLNRLGFVFEIDSNGAGHRVNDTATGRFEGPRFKTRKELHIFLTGLEALAENIEYRSPIPIS